MRAQSAYEQRLTALFWAKVQVGTEDECWPWLGYTKPSGHGLTSLQSMPIHASRKAWILTHGPIRGDLCVNHRCDYPACCNPNHLYLGTRADNMIDMWGKTDGFERAPRGRNHVLTLEQVGELYQMRKNGATLKVCAAKFGCHIATVCRIVTRRRKQILDQRRADRLSAISR